MILLYLCIAVVDAEDVRFLVSCVSADLPIDDLL
jgi:hypothetical protein